MTTINHVIISRLFFPLARYTTPTHVYLPSRRLNQCDQPQSVSHHRLKSTANNINDSDQPCHYQQQEFSPRRFSPRRLFFLHLTVINNRLSTQLTTNGHQLLSASGYLVTAAWSVVGARVKVVMVTTVVLSFSFFYMEFCHTGYLYEGPLFFYLHSPVITHGLPFSTCHHYRVVIIFFNMEFCHTGYLYEGPFFLPSLASHHSMTAILQRVCYGTMNTV